MHQVQRSGSRRGCHKGAMVRSPVTVASVRTRWRLPLVSGADVLALAGSRVGVPGPCSSRPRKRRRRGSGWSERFARASHCRASVGTRAGTGWPARVRRSATGCQRPCSVSAGRRSQVAQSPLARRSWVIRWRCCHWSTQSGVRACRHGVKPAGLGAPSGGAMPARSQASHARRSPSVETIGVGAAIARASSGQAATHRPQPSHRSASKERPSSSSCQAWRAHEATQARQVAPATRWCAQRSAWMVSAGVVRFMAG